MLTETSGSDSKAHIGTYVTKDWLLQPRAEGMHCSWHHQTAPQPETDLS